MHVWQPGSEVVLQTTPAEAAGVTYLGNSNETQGVTHLGNGVLPTQVTECYLTNRADQVPEPLELPEGTPIRYSNKVLSGQRPESEAEVIAYVRSLGYEEEDGKYMLANWKSNGFTNGGRPIRDWKAVIDSRALQEFLPSQKKLVERTAKNGTRRNLI